MSKQEYSKKARVHTVYKTKDDKRVPGVTTIVGMLGWNKNVLVRWANNLGIKGIDSSKFVDDKADIGKLAHLMITDWLCGKKTNTDDYTKNQIDQAENSVLSFFEWEKSHKIKPILIEGELVSEEHKFGGTADIYGEINGDTELIDLKTGSGIYPEMIIQVSAYKSLLEEHEHRVDKVRILNIPRSENESFKEQVVENHDVGWKIFLNCLSIYKLKKELKNGGRSQ